MTSSAVTDSSTSIEARLARIEEMLSTLSAGVNQAPVMLSMATDTVDELLQNAVSKGIDVDDRIQKGKELLLRLSDPLINKALNNLLDVVEQGPGLVSMAADTIDEGIQQANSGSIKVEDRIQSLVSMLNTISDPATAERLEALVKFGDQASGLVSMAVDSIDELMSIHGEDVSTSLAFLQKDNLTFIKNVGDAMTEAHQESPAKVGGIFGILRLLKDPGRQKALGFLMNVLKNLGNKI